MCVHHTSSPTTRNLNTTLAHRTPPYSVASVAAAAAARHHTTSTVVVVAVAATAAVCLYNSFALSHTFDRVDTVIYVLLTNILCFFKTVSLLVLLPLTACWLAAVLATVLLGHVSGSLVVCINVLCELLAHVSFQSSIWVGRWTPNKNTQHKPLCQQRPVCVVRALLATLPATGCASIECTFSSTPKTVWFGFQSVLTKSAQKWPASLPLCLICGARGEGRSAKQTKTE